MTHLLIVILDDLTSMPDLLQAWRTIGVPGTTILESAGLGRVRRAGIRYDLPLIPSLSDIFLNTETQHRTIFTVVKSQSQIEAIVKATKSVVGDLEQPDTGFLFVVPVSQVYGISKLA